MPHSRYRRPAPVLPPAESLPFPGNLIRQCEDCGLRQGCTAPVPGENVVPCDVLFVGQNPGKNEDEWGKPFIGMAGQYLNSLLFQASTPRESVAIVNLVKCLTPGNRQPTIAEIKACAKWLDIELGIVNPKIIVAMGGPAIARFLGANAGTVEHLHGKPVELDGRIILPCYHPAAALRDTAKLRQCSEDFQVLRGLVRGVPPSEYIVKDEYPNPVYKVADTPELLAEMEAELASAEEYSVDTEVCRNRLWSAQFSMKPGTAWFLPIAEEVDRIDLTKYPGTAILHNYLFDVQYVKVRDDQFVDSMVMAYLVGQAQGLKELASRLCGVPMVNYNEVVRPGQDKLSLEYLTKITEQDWPDPPPIEETKWNNKKGCLVTRHKKPWNIKRKEDNILKAFREDPDTDLWDRWRKIPEEERTVVESILGAMPESSLMDIPFEQATQYAARDADVTLRVYHKLKKLISDLELDFVLHMDTAILPMVYDMMQNGMAIDLDHLRNLSEDYDARMRAKASELASIVGHPFNPSSSPQVAQVVYAELGFKPTAYTDTGLISTDDAELKKTGHPVAKGVIEYRRLSKMKGTYADNLIRNHTLDEQGVPRIHTTLTTTRVETGRLSSKKSDDGEGAALQNIPTRNKEGKAIKNGFIAPDGWRMLEGDLKQIEMVTQAHLAQCRGLIELFLSGKDPHTTTASKLFGVPYEEAKKEKYRYPCKRAGFGIIYMIGADGLYTQINEYIADLEMEGTPVEVDAWSLEDCDKFIEDYYRLYPEIRDYQMEKAAEARRYGYVRDLFGRIRYIPEITCPIRGIQEAGVRQAANFSVTSSAQGIIKLGMGKLWRDLPRTKWAKQVRWLMQIHDSLVMEVKDEDELVKSYANWILGIVSNVVKLSVPVGMDFKHGKRWGSLEELTKESQQSLLQ